MEDKQGKYYFVTIDCFLIRKYSDSSFLSNVQNLHLSSSEDEIEAYQKKVVAMKWQEIHYLLWEDSLSG